MSLYAIADLHLSQSVNKPMDIFGAAWENHTAKLKENWILGDDDTVVIPGDLSWAMDSEELKADLLFLSELKGRKIISKGNHDYWWSTVKKLEQLVAPYGNIEFLHNNSFVYGDYSICGTRGWIQEPDLPADIKVLRREALRLEASLKTATKAPMVFLHYPPLFSDIYCTEIMEILIKYKVSRCFYGHIHDRSIKYAFEGIKDGIDFKLVSADSLAFRPLLIL